MMAVTNASPQTVYLPMTDATTVIGAGLQIKTKAGRAFRPVPTCAIPVCEDGCQVSACAPTSAVRALLPGETFSFEWQSFELQDGNQTCISGERACLTPKPAGDGRYLMTVCYGTVVRPVNGAQTASRSPLDHSVLLDAAADDIRCDKPLEFGVPGYDVRYQVVLK